MTGATPLRGRPAASRPGSVVHTGRMVPPPLPGSAASRHPLTSVLDPLLLDVLACPAEHHTPLVPGEPDNALAMSLSCPECGRIFDVRDGIPVLLLDDARHGPTGPDGPAAAGS